MDIDSVLITEIEQPTWLTRAVMCRDVCGMTSGVANSCLSCTLHLAEIHCFFHSPGNLTFFTGGSYRAD